VRRSPAPPTYPLAHPVQVGHALAQQDFSHPNSRRRQLTLAPGVKPLDDQSGAEP
jgi:hypothetical protein